MKNFLPLDRKLCEAKLKVYHEKLQIREKLF